MSEPTTYVVCEGCNQVLDPSEPDSVIAVQRQPVADPEADSPKDEDGLQMWFHEGCYPGAPNYRRSDS